MLTWISPLKPLISTLLLPPAGPLLLIMAGWVIGRYAKRWGQLLCASGVVFLWLLSCSATAYGLNHVLLRSYPAVGAKQLKQVQAIVVLGGGIDLYAPEYGQATLSAAASQRLLYGRYLTSLHSLPLVYSGGKGWGAAEQQTQSEAGVAAYELQRDFGMRFDFVDDVSRDTRENALRTFATLSAQGITRIALVTHDWHMQRSVMQFEAAGFEVLPAPMGYTQPPMRWDTDYLPSSGGLQASRRVLHEWLGRLHY